MMAQMVGRPPKKETPADAPEHAAAVAVNVKRAREALGITQQQMCDGLSISQKTISEMERGRSNPNLRTLEKIAAFLGLTFEELVTLPSDSDTKPKPTATGKGRQKG
jgi:transcriptional regulator with XRE-family HTH domain